MGYKEELINKYKLISKQLSSNYEEIKITEELLEDKKLDYMTRREYQSDIISCKLSISKLERELNEVTSLAQINNIKLIEESEKNKTYQKRRLT